MSGAKLTAMMIFGALSLVATVLFLSWVLSILAAVIAGIACAAALCTFIWFADTGKRAFARGFMGLGLVFVLIPAVGFGAIGEDLAYGAVQAFETGETIREAEVSQLAVSAIVASMGMALGFLVGMFLILIGGLMNRKPREVVPT